MILLLFGIGVADCALAADHAVVLMYHHIGSDTPATTSVSLESFERHLDYLEKHGFRVVALPLLLERLSNQKPVPENSVAITFDDAYQSVFSVAAPRLRRRKWPFTVFVNTDAIDKGYARSASWAQLRLLRADGATIGNHSLSHAHMIQRHAGEDDEAWRRRIRHEITGAQSRLNEEIGQVEKIFAYPYGEFTGELQSIVAELGFFGMGQHSGALGHGSDWAAAPRFPMANGFDDIKQFALKVKTRPLPVQMIAPKSHLIADNNDKPAMRFRLGDGDFTAQGLACYASGQGSMGIHWLDRQRRLVEALPLKSLARGRSRFNCTIPSASEAGVYYWFSYPLIKVAQ